MFFQKKYKLYPMKNLQIMDIHDFAEEITDMPFFYNDSFNVLSELTKKHSLRKCKKLKKKIEETYYLGKDYKLVILFNSSVWEPFNFNSNS